MSYRKWKLGSLLLVAMLSSVSPIYAASGNKPWQVTELLADKPMCTSRGTYSYNATWKPIIWDNRPWPRYHVLAHNCVTGPITCGADRCGVQASGCRTGAPGAWVAVTADIGKSISGVRQGVPPPGSGCK